MEDVALSTISLRLDTTMQERVRQIADARHRTSDDVLNEAIEAYVTREEKRELFKRDAVAAWEHYQATGLHLTAEEADEWLSKLEAGEDAPIPECHI